MRPPPSPQSGRYEGLKGSSKRSSNAGFPPAVGTDQNIAFACASWLSNIDTS